MTRLFSMTAVLTLLCVAVGCPSAGDGPAPDEEAPTPVYDARVWISPASASAGVPRTVQIWGSGTGFASGEVSVDFGDGVDVQVLLVDSSFHMRAQILVATGAALGPRDVTVTWGSGTQQRILRDGLVVETGSLELSPRAAALGETVTVQVSGWGTSFSPGLTVASLGPWIEVRSDIEVTSSSRLSFVAHVSPRAEVGPRDLVVYNGPEVWTLQGAFHVDRIDRAMRVVPDEAFQGSTIEVRVEADDAGFLDGITEVDLGTGVVIEAVTVIDPDHLAARVRVGNNARVGLRDVSTLTPINGDVRTRLLLDGFTVHPVEANPLRARVSLTFGITRVWVPEVCGWQTLVNASALFYEPNDFPCPSTGGSSTLGAPARYDLTSTGFSTPAGGSSDCPSVKTFDAGPFVTFAGDDGDVVLARDYDSFTSRVVYTGQDLTVDDFQEDTFFDLVTPGGDLGFSELPPWTIEDALLTMPRDYQQLGPDYCALSHPRSEALAIRWTPAQTYDTADLYLYLFGAPQDEGIPLMFIYPWDDGAFDIPPEDLAFFTEGPAQLYQVGAIRTRFEVPGSEYPLAGIGASTIFWRGEFVFE
jgi:hypothetical protein